MRSKRTWIDILAPVFGVLTVVLVVYSLVHLLWLEPFYRGESYGLSRGERRGFDVGPGWQSQEARERFEGAFSDLEIKNISGPVNIEGWNQDSVEVHYIKKARSAKYLEEFEIEIEERGNTLFVRPRYRKIPGSPFGSVSFDVKVPASIKEITASNVSGTINLENLAASVDQVLETVSGRISTELSGNLRAKSVSGSISFASTGRLLDIRSTSGRIRGEILALDPSGSVEIETISGGVDLQAFPGLDASLRLQSVSGSISCDFPVQIREQKRNRLNGDIGKGSVPFRVQTVSGRIHLHE